MSAQRAPAPQRHEGVTVTRHLRTDRLVARKSVAPGAEHRLRREVAVLRLLDGLAVCTPVDPNDDGSDGQIDLAYVGPRTLVELEALRPEELLVALAGIARTLQGAHERGVSHGRLTAEHVLLDEHGGPVLAGWSAAGLREDALAHVQRLDRAHGENQHDKPRHDKPRHNDDRHDDRPGSDLNGRPTGPEEPAGSDTPEPAATFDPAADVAALGELAARSAQASRVLGGRVRTQLAAVAAAARHPDPSVRPPLGELVRVLDLAGGDPDGPVDHARHRRRTERTARAMRVADGPIGRLSLAAVGAAAAAALTVIALDRLGADPSAGPATAARSVASDSMSSSAHTNGDAAVGSDQALDPGRNAQAVPASAAASNPYRRNPSSAAQGPSEPTVATEPNRPTPTTTAGALADRSQPTAAPGDCPSDAGRLAGEGLPARCARSVVLDGERIRIGSARYSLGSPGDQAGLGDPLCQGLLSPIVWERASGRVYLFDGWATATTTVTGRLAGSAPGSTGLLDPLGEGCGPVLVTMNDGTVTELHDLEGG